MLTTYRQAASPVTSGSDDRIELGTVLPDPATLNRLVARWIEAISDPYLPTAERLALTPLEFEAYCYAVEGQSKITRDTRRREALTWQIEETGKGVGSLHVLGEESPEVLAFLRFDRQADDTPDLTGWLRYLRRKIPVEKLMDRWPEFRPVAAFPEAGRRMHTLVVAATGHGKSEVLKAMLHHYAERPRAGVLLIDPGRTLAVDVARWPELHRDNRIIYVEPELRPGLTVGFNPFDRAQTLDARDKSHLAETIGTAISEMTANLTDNMETLVTNCARVLLDEPDATMEDLGRMVVEPPDPKKSPYGGFIDRRRERLLKKAYDHPDRHVRNFFRFRFGAGSYALNRDFLGNRVDRITGMVDVRNALFGPSTIDLERELDAGKFVVVNLAKYGKRKQRAALGRLLVTMAAGIASRRMQREGPYTPLHIVVDEVTSMTSPQMIEVLNEARKVGVHATFAQQTEGEGFTKEQARSLVKNTLCRLAATKNRREGAELLDNEVSADELPPLSAGQFWVRWEGVPGIHTVEVRSDLVVRNRQGNIDPDVSPERWLPDLLWEAYLDRLTQPGGYYRKAETRPLHTDTTPPARPGRVQPERPAERDEAPEHHLPERPKPVSGRDKKVPAYEAVLAKGRATKPRKPTAEKPKTDSVVSPGKSKPD
jgi:Helicase HerA, central domain